ncbi:type VII secretion system-associated protein [Streptomyces sp. NPDC020951]|uniref:type VII secretion system-associated protein n=1 Tax=Streptomyces sp. NPDC020951 TaxID=3365104 RepID=UPI0037A9B969
MSEPTTDPTATPVTTDPATDTTTVDAIDPAPPEEFVKAAKLLPDHWLYYVDPTWRGEGEPPEWAVVGQWRTDLDGEIVEWQDNEAYKPSPDAHGWPEPADVIDAAIQLATTGYAPAETVTRELATAELAVLVTLDGTPVSTATPDGIATVPVFSHPTFLHRYGQLAFELIRTPDLLDRLPADHTLCVNPSATVSMVVDLDALRGAVVAAETEAAAAAAAEAEAEAAPRVPTESGSFTNGASTSDSEAATATATDLDLDFGIDDDDAWPSAESAPATAAAPSTGGN